MLDAKEALEKLAMWFEEQDGFWRKTAQIAETEASKQYYLGLAAGYRTNAEQLRGLLYELKNPPPSGPWDSQGHMQSEQADWTSDHPLMEYDEGGRPTLSGVFYR